MTNNNGFISFFPPDRPSTPAPAALALAASPLRQSLSDHLSQDKMIAEKALTGQTCPRSLCDCNGPYATAALTDASNEGPIHQ